jgi:pyruvate,water dikinase
MAGQTDAPLTLPLEASWSSLAQVGGKGAALAKLAAAGLPIPPGFHLTTTAYRRFVEHNRLRAPILAAVAASRSTRPEPAERAAPAGRRMGRGLRAGRLREAGQRAGQAGAPCPAPPG